MRNFYDVLHNFISPVTGHVLADPDYVLVGNDLGIAIPSPDLIDLRLDQINLRMDVDELSSAYFIVGFENKQLPNAQVLYNMSDGYVYNTAGIISTTPTIPITSLPNLTENNVWVGDDLNRPVETQRLDVLNLPAFFQPGVVFTLESIPPGAPVNFGIHNLYKGNLPIIPNLSEPIEPGLTLRLDTSNLPNLPRGKMWLGGLNYIPPYIATIPTPPYIEVIGSLNWDGRGNPFIEPLPPPFTFDYKDYAVPQAIGLNPNELFVGNTDPLYYGEITTTVALNIANLPDLTSGKVWQGNGENRPVEVSVAPNDATYVVRTANDALPNAQSLLPLGLGITKVVVDGYLSIAIPGIDYVTVSELLALQEEMIAGFGIVEGQLLLVEGSIVRLQDEILLLTGSVIALGILIESEIIGLQLEINSANTRIDDTNTRIDNLTLTNIPAGDGPINFGGNNLTNLADPSSTQDGATKNYVDNAVATGTSITLTGFVTGGPPVSGVITTSKTPGDLDMGNYKITTLADPVSSQDAVNKRSLQISLEEQLYKELCIVCATSNISGTYDNGASGVGATLTGTTVLIIDGYSSFVIGQRILLTGQTSAIENGIYIITDIQTVPSDSFILTRTTDFDTPEKMVINSIIPIQSGNTYHNTFWFLSTTVISIGVTDISFTQFTPSINITHDALLLGSTNNTIVPLNNPVNPYQVLVSSSSAPTWSTSKLLSYNKNLFLGVDCGNDTLTAFSGENCAFGYNSLPLITGGTRDNVAIGADTLSLLTNAIGNTAIGNHAGISTNSTGAGGEYNTFIGLGAGYDNKQGSYNTIIGAESGFHGTNNSNCVLIGYNTGQSGIDSTDYTNTIAIGANIVITSSNTCYLGSSGVNLIVGSGSGNITGLGAITTGSWQGNVVDVTYGGTGRNTLAQYNLLVGNGTSGVNTISTGTTGTILIGNTGANPSFSSTPTIDSITINNTPVGYLDGTNKLYVDTLFNQFKYKTICYAATTANLAATYYNGASGLGATLTSTVSGVFSIDGVTPPLNSRILVKNQTLSPQNGIYILINAGSVSTAWILLRAYDYDEPIEITNGTLVPIQNGTVNNITSWLQDSTVSVIGTDNIIFVPFSYNPTIFLQSALNLADISNSSIARTNLGLTNISIQTVTTNAVLVGAASNSINSISLTNGQILIGSTGSTPVASLPSNGTNISWTGGAGTLTANITGQISLANGGTNTSLTASNGGIVYSTASGMGILSGTPNSKRFLLSGSSSSPSWASSSLREAGGNLFLGITTGNDIVSGSDNTGFGITTLTSLTSGSFNTGFGTFALGDLSSGISNTAVGHGSLGSITSTSQNSAFGYLTLANSTGTQNCAFGAGSLYASGVGNKNTAFGFDSLLNVSGSSNNTAIGSEAADTYGSYNNCVFLGADTDATVSGLTNAIAIGYGARVSTNNTCVIGQSSSPMTIKLGTGEQVATLSNSLNQFAAPVANIEMNNYALVNAGYVNCGRLRGDVSLPPTIVRNATGLGSAGTATVTSGSTSIGGEFVLTTGTSLSAGTAATVTLQVAQINSVYGVVLFPANQAASNTADNRPYIVINSTTSFDIKFGTAATPSTTYRYIYSIIA